MKRAQCNQLNVQSAHGNEVDRSSLTPCWGDAEHVPSPTTPCVEDVLITATATVGAVLSADNPFHVNGMELLTVFPPERGVACPTPHAAGEDDLHHMQQPPTFTGL